MGIVTNIVEGCKKLENGNWQVGKMWSGVMELTNIRRDSMGGFKDIHSK